MTEIKNYKSTRIIDGKPRQVIVDKTGKIIDRSPSTDELKILEKEIYYKKPLLKYTDEQLINYLRQFYEDNGRIPEERDFINNSKYPSFNTYHRRFDSWNDAIRMTGFTPKNNMNDKELLQYIVQFHNENGRTPMESDFTNQRYPYYTTYQYRFGSWNSAIKLAGLQVNVFENLTNDELLEHVAQFYEINGRLPTTRDFINNHEHPSLKTYQNHFGSWENALKLVQLDTESMVKKEVLETNNQKGRFAEICVIKHFVQQPVDLAGINHCNPYDGICPNGLIYDVKSSALYKTGNHYQFGIRRMLKDKEIDEKIQIYYLLAFNKDYTELMHVWRIPSWLVVKKDGLYIGSNPWSHAEFTIENMKEYDITDKFKDVFRKY